MAIVKLGGIVTEISGKIGGQSFSNYGSFATLKNITQRNTLPSSKQARQRFITGQISGSWAQLTQSQRDGWETASVNYTYYNKIGVQVTRNGFQTFNFLNQNLTLIGVAPNVNAPAYVPVTQPKINIIDISSGNFEIQSNNSSATYLYALFAAPNLPNGVSYAQNRMKYCGTVTSAQLNAGYDVIADIEAVFGNLAFPNKISIIIDPINQTTGNRSQYVTEILNIDTPMIIEVTVADGGSITIPFVSGGTYAGSVNFGDGTVNTFSAWNSAGLTHTYTNGGVYLVTITGTFPKFAVAGGAFKTYLSDIKQFGSNRFTRINFNGSTLLINVSCFDTPSLVAGPAIQNLFKDCTGMLSFNNIEYWDVSNQTSLLSFLQGTNISPNLNAWGVGLVTTMELAFESATCNPSIEDWRPVSLQSLKTTWNNNPVATPDLSAWVCNNLTTLERMAQSALIFNTNLNGFNPDGVANFFRAFLNTDMDFDFSGWDIRNATTMNEFLKGANMSVENWNATLIAWNALVNPPVGINMFCNVNPTGAGITARDNLIATWGWTFNVG
jgi:hypothetical protein